MCCHAMAYERFNFRCCDVAVLYKLLVDARILHAGSSAIKLKSIWSRCQALFVRFLEAAMRKTDEVCSICFIS